MYMCIFGCICNKVYTGYDQIKLAIFNHNHNLIWYNIFSVISALPGCKESLGEVI